MDVDYQYELYNEWCESKEKITLAEFCYKKGRKDMLQQILNNSASIAGFGSDLVISVDKLKEIGSKFDINNDA